ncbi:M16 family metallopeptidase [Shewanella pneumatophori]|uniref:Insulinase family protein n=1 Tax=Shewanella pneumatophori TaxID=314092 RepID=A0A9X1ZKI0_9GAMM|nr:insulinase family protein [Shewanella pneumatophori]MCL1137601.1 insulinase family protein [Shewanella pneumatophori]
MQTMFMFRQAQPKQMPQTLSYQAVFLGLLLVTLFGLLGCQQTQIEFTAAAEPSLPVFNSLQGAPIVTPLTSTSATALSNEALSIESLEKSPFNSELKRYSLNNTLSGLNHISLVAYSQQPLQNLDVLLQAFIEKTTWLAQQSNLACSESLRIRASMHSLTMSIDCPDSPELASSLLLQFWQANSFNEIDIANVRRQLKLAKHINAYSGAEIDDVWAKKILGEQHIYNQALNDTSLAAELDLTKLNQVRDKIISQSKWALLTNQSLAKNNEFSAKLAQDLAALTAKSQQVAPQPLSTFKLKVPASNSQKTLFIIDAPGSVQTQVRIGYPLAVDEPNQQQTADDIQDCKLLASWLGRSFSGRLYHDLREVRGLTYGIYGRCFDNPLSRTLKFYGSTKLEHSGAFISGVLDHLALATESSASIDEVNALKTYLTSQKILRQANYRAIEADTIKQLIRGSSTEQQQAQNRRLDALTPEQLQGIAQSVFLNTPYIVIRGDRAKIESDLKQKLPEWTLVAVSADD